MAKTKKKINFTDKEKRKQLKEDILREREKFSDELTHSIQ